MSEALYMILAGPTGVGKTDLAIAVAQRLNSEIVGADAFQIYRGLDLLTGKPSSEQLSAVRHHLVSYLDLSVESNAQAYSVLAMERIEELNQRGIIPLVVGGTGFYIEALQNTLPSLPPVDQKQRTILESYTTPELLTVLQDHDPVAWSRIDQRNRRRVIRALEVCLTTGQPFSSFSQKPPPSIPRIVLSRDRSELHQLIDGRIRRMFQEGVVEEVDQVKEIGPTAAQCIGFREIKHLLAGTITREQCVARIQQRTKAYAKRQLTWFQRHPYAVLSAHQSPVELVHRLKEWCRALKWQFS